MPRRPAPPKAAARGPDSDKKLAVKDGLREVRFNVKLGARKLVRAVETATRRPEPPAAGPSVPLGPLALFGEPLNLAVRTTATLLSTVDHAAVDLLASDGAHRSMSAPLCSSAAYFLGPRPPAGDLRGFAADHVWRYRHWLALTRRGEVFVHEQPMAMAAAEVAQALAALPPGTAAPGDDAAPQTAAALIVRALKRRDILSKPTLSADTDPEALPALVALGAVVVVLAGEIAAGGAAPGGREPYLRALTLADEVAVAERGAWEAALASRTPMEALARWMAFAVRYV